MTPRALSTRPGVEPDLGRAAPRRAERRDDDRRPGAHLGQDTGRADGTGESRPGASGALAQLIERSEKDRTWANVDALAQRTIRALNKLASAERDVVVTGSSRAIRTSCPCCPRCVRRSPRRAESGCR